MAREIDPRKVATKQKDGAIAASDDYYEGMQDLNENPCELAAKPEAQKRMKTSWNDAMDSGVIADGLKKVSLSEFKDSISREAYERGVDKSVKYEKFIEDYAPVLEEASNIAEKEPHETYAQRMAAFRKAVDHIHNHPYKRKKPRL